VILTLIFNVCIHFKRMWRRTFVCVQADYMADDVDDQKSDRFLLVYLL
jgi:abortive infection bacteriophage resistance protein